MLLFAFPFAFLSSSLFLFLSSLPSLFCVVVSLFFFFFILLSASPSRLSASHLSSSFLLLCIPNYSFLCVMLYIFYFILFSSLQFHLFLSNISFVLETIIHSLFYRCFCLLFFSLRVVRFLLLPQAFLRPDSYFILSSHANLFFPINNELFNCFPFIYFTICLLYYFSVFLFAYFTT